MTTSRDPEVLPPEGDNGDDRSPSKTSAPAPAEDGAAGLESDFIDAEILSPDSLASADDEGEALADGSPIISAADATAPELYPLVPNDDDMTPLATSASQVSALSAYMSQLAHHAPISREEEHDLAVSWTEDGDVTAARKLVVSNLRLVVKIAMEYRRAWTNTLDLIQEGNVGLMEAVQRYDPYQGVKLSSYAVYWIRAYILKYILDNMRSVRLGTTRASRKLFFRLNKEKVRLEREGFEVEPKMIAERLDVSEDDVLEMEARLSRPDTYLDAPLRREDGEGATVGEGFATAGASAESQVGDEELRSTFLQNVEDFSEELEERDQRILRERLLAAEPSTLAEMGKEFGVSRERVRQLEARLLTRLRAYMKDHMVDFEYYAPPGEE
ncbi:MAG: RNA polymerase factor sigma-32 [Myxococcota bacterium]|nr:RNA polymerase factor sigma-32 [Myxococcota bacterium]